MSAAWVVYVLVIGMLLSFAAIALESAAQRLNRSTRWIWTGALLTMMALAALAPIRSREAPTVLVEHAATGKSTSLVATASESDGGALVAVAAALRTLEGAAVSALGGISMVSARTAIVAWCGMSVVIIALVVSVNASMLRRRTRWPRIHLHGATVRVARDVGPAVVGVTSPEIIVPGWLLERSEEEQRLAVAHETEHVVARDNVLLAAGWIVAAALPWHPAAWWMLGRLRLAIELDCDARVLRRGAPARRYGQLLIDIADRMSGQRVVSLALADSTSHLERRLLAMKNSRIRLGRTRAALLGVTALVAVVAACEARVPTSAEIQDADVAAIERKARDANLLDKQAMLTEYRIDGREATAKEVHALKPIDVAGVEVSKDGGTNRVYVNTMKETAGQQMVGGRARTLLPSKVAGAALHVDSTKPSADTLVMLPSRTKFDGLYIIDGEIASEEQFGRLTKAPDRIESIEIIKGEAALRAWPNAKARNGVIRVTTKK